MRCVPLLLACLALTWAVAPVALDSGTTWTRLAHYNPSSVEGIDLVVSDQGDRRFATVVGFSQGEPVFGDEADSLAQRRPERAVPHLPRLLGFAYAGDNFQSYRGDFPRVPLGELPRGDISVDAGWDHKPSIAELYALFLHFTFGQARAQLNLNLPHSDPLPVILTVPLDAAVPYREMMSQVVEAAGGSVVQVISSAAAAATDWTVRKLQPGEDATIVIVDVGTLSSSAAIVHAAKSKEGRIKLNVAKWTVDDSLGGYHIDKCLAKWLKRRIEVRVVLPEHKNSDHLVAYRFRHSQPSLEWSGHRSASRS